MQLCCLCPTTSLAHTVTRSSLVLDLEGTILPPSILIPSFLVFVARSTSIWQALPDTSDTALTLLQRKPNQLYFLWTFKTITDRSGWEHIFLLSDIHGYGSSFEGRPSLYMQQARLPPSLSNRAFEQFVAPRNTEPDTSGYPCSQCDKTFASPGSRWNHIAAKHRKATYPCACGKVYTYITGLTAHKKLCPLRSLPVNTNTSQ